MLYLYIVAAVLVVATFVVRWWYSYLGNEVSYFYRNPSFDLRLQYLQNGWKSVDDLPSVSIDMEGGHKYVVMECAGRIFIRADKTKRFHGDIVAPFMFSVGSRKVTCLGGGMIEVDPTLKRIHVYGTSQGFGMDRDRERTMRMIEEATGYDAGSQKNVPVAA